MLTDQGLGILLAIPQTAAAVVLVMPPTSHSPISSYTTILASTQSRNVLPITERQEVATPASSIFVTSVCRTGLVLLSAMWLVRCNAQLHLLAPAWRLLALILLILSTVLLLVSTCVTMCRLLGSTVPVLLGRRTADRQIDSYIVSQKHDPLLDSFP
jgi:glucan phosphoethanolaminetransferase (alkaline phosphatase superfamily)